MGVIAHEQWDPTGTKSRTPSPTAPTHSIRRVRSLFRDKRNPYPSGAAFLPYKGLHWAGEGGASCGEAVHNLDQLQSEMGTTPPWEARGGTAGLLRV